jgi:hypothetical protein
VVNFFSSFMVAFLLKGLRWDSDKNPFLYRKIVVSTKISSGNSVRREGAEVLAKDPNCPVAPFT